MMRALLATGLVAWSSAACILESPQYEGTTFTCADSSSECPAGYRCVEQVCRADVPTSDPAATPDAGTTPQPPAVDASVPPTPSPDAMPRPITTVTLSGTEITRDAHIEYEYPNHNHGREDYVSIDADPLRVGLLRFKLSSIPPGAEVVAAEMVLRIYDPIEDGELVAYSLLESWDEDAVSWNQRKEGVPWVTVGAGVGSYAPTPLFSLAAREDKAYTIPLPVSTVQTWVTQPLLNHGMKWVSTSQNGRGGEFQSSEAGNPADVPTITIQYR